MLSSELAVFEQMAADIARIANAMSVKQPKPGPIYRGGAWVSDERGSRTEPGPNLGRRSTDRQPDMPEPDYTCQACGGDWTSCHCSNARIIAAANRKLRERDARIERLSDFQEQCGKALLLIREYHMNLMGSGAWQDCVQNPRVDQLVSDLLEKLTSVCNQKDVLEQERDAARAELAELTTQRDEFARHAGESDEKLAALRKPEPLVWEDHTNMDHAENRYYTVTIGGIKVFVGYANNSWRWCADLPSRNLTEAKAEFERLVSALRSQPQPAKVAELVEVLEAARIGAVVPYQCDVVRERLVEALALARSLDTQSVNRALLEAAEAMRNSCAYYMNQTSMKSANEGCLAKWDAAIAAAKEAL